METNSTLVHSTTITLRSTIFHKNKYLMHLQSKWGFERTVATTRCRWCASLHDTCKQEHARFTRFYTEKLKKRLTSVEHAFCSFQVRFSKQMRWQGNGHQQYTRDSEFATLRILRTLICIWVLRHLLVRVDSRALALQHQIDRDP